MAKIDGAAPAFPQSELVRDAEGKLSLEKLGGVSVRAYIAARAMQGIVANAHWSNQDRGGATWWDVIASDACTLADALIAELNKEEKADEQEATP